MGGFIFTIRQFAVVGVNVGPYHGRHCLSLAMTGGVLTEAVRSNPSMPPKNFIMRSASRSNPLIEFTMKSWAGSHLKLLSPYQGVGHPRSSSCAANLQARRAHQCELGNNQRAAMHSNTRMAMQSTQIHVLLCKAYAPAVAYLSAITTLNEQYHLHTASEA